MKLFFCLLLILLPLTCRAESPKCYLIDSPENRTKFLIHFTDKEKYYILDKNNKKYTPTDSITCLSEIDLKESHYICVITN